MKNIIFKYSSFLLLLVVVFTGCKKQDPTSPEVTGAQLIKINSWNPSTGAETANLELTYNSSDIVISAKGSNSDSYAIEYDATGKLTKVNKTNPNGRTTVYTLAYNSTGQVNKVTQDNASSGAAIGTNVLTYEYNSGGKISKVINTYAASVSIVEYTWSGDNIIEAKTTVTPGTYLAIAKYTYDDKKNPYSLGGNVMAFVFYGSPPSKNNIVEISTTIGSTTSLQKRSYEYNSAGYATSMKLLDGSNEGSKFYYK